MITGLDLVEYQIRVAEGHPLPIKQEEVQMNGHAVELRVYAENAAKGFVPSTGMLKKYQIPVGQGVRVDDGYAQGLEIPIHYDPMISKLVAFGVTRQEAIEILINAINNYEIQGVDTTLAFGKFTLSHPDFVTGNFDTNFVEKYLSDFVQQQQTINLAVAKFATWLYHKKRRILTLPKMD